MKLSSLVLVGLCSLGSVFAIFEDQVNSIDWKIELPRPISTFAPKILSHNKESPTIYVYSNHSNYLAAIEAQTGFLQWQKKLYFEKFNNRVFLYPLDSSTSLRVSSPYGFQASVDLLVLAMHATSYELLAFDSLNGTLVFNQIFENVKELKYADYISIKGQKLFILLFNEKAIFFDCKSQTVVFHRKGDILDAGLNKFNGKLYLITGISLIEINLANFKEKIVTNEAPINNILGLALVDNAMVTVMLVESKYYLLDLDTGHKYKLKYRGSMISEFQNVRKNMLSLYPSNFVVIPTSMIGILSKKIFTIHKLDKLSQFSYDDVAKSLAIITLNKTIFFHENGNKEEKNIQLESNIVNRAFVSPILYLSRYNTELVAYNVTSVSEVFILHGGLASLVGTPHLIEAAQGDVSGTNSNKSSNTCINTLINLFETDALQELNLDLMFWRLRAQVNVFIDFISNLIFSMEAILEEFIFSRGMLLINIYRGNVQSSEYLVSDKKNFGFLKNIVLLNDRGIIYVINTETGKVVSTNLIHNFTKHQFIDSFLLTAMPQKIAYFTETKMYIFDPTCNNIYVKQQFPNKIIKVYKPRTDLDDFLIIFEVMKAKVVIEANHTHHISPDDLMSINLVISSSDRTVSAKQIFAPSLQTLILEDSFQVALPEGFLFSTIVYPEDESISSIGKHLGGGKVMIKFVTSKIVSVISTNSRDNEILVYILSANSGNLIHMFHLTDCEPNTFSAIMFDNNFLCSCFSLERQHSHLLSVSFYYDIIFEKFELSPFKSLTNILNKLHSAKILVQSNNYLLPKKVKRLSVTKTKHGISEKKVLAALANGQVVMIDERLFEPRRPNAHSKEDTEQGLLPYSPIIPIFSSSIISHRNDLGHIESINSFATNLESTSLLLSVGSSLYFSRIQPSSGFDLMPPDFNYALLIFMVSGLSVTVALLNSRLKEKRTREAWK